MPHHWYLIHTKPRQEQNALVNLGLQGFECYLPLITTEKIRRRKLTQVSGPLFPRYLFIQLEQGLFAKSWAPIRSTLGVSRLVCFGTEPARIDALLVEQIRQHENIRVSQPTQLFSAGERLTITDGPFAGIEAIYQMDKGESRVMVLIELLSKSVKLQLDLVSLKKMSV